MAKSDIPKRVIVVLLFLVILVSFLGTLAVLQMYAAAPREVSTDTSQATISLRVLPGAKAEPSADDFATISIKINKNEG